jgi:hypothetical protein
MNYRLTYLAAVTALALTLLAACTTSSKETPAFEVHDAAATGIEFANILKADSAFNMFKYMYFYNGAGICAGDFNNDGLIDLYFAGNQVSDELYLNKGALTFDNISEKAGIPRDGGWSTGVSVVDINADGLLDIYVCRVGKFETLTGHNLLLINTGIQNGIPRFKDSAAAYGMQFQGFSTQAAFFDYDLDGDLDCYLLNHAVHHSGKFAERSKFLGTYDSLSGDRLYRNDGRRFTDVTHPSGIHSSEIGYGLGIVVSDINLDGWPDLYIGNDFHENDYLYINKRNGTFEDVLSASTTHTSQFSMGVDAADINNDALPDIISMDMLPVDPYILKRSLGEDAYDIFRMKVRYGYHPQYARNNLQLNRGNGCFSEVGCYAGIYATDWSWAPLFVDFDNDGLKDLFISNGIPKRLNDIDYVNFISNRVYQDKIRNNQMSAEDLALVDKFPEIKLPNYFFQNKGEASFEAINTRVSGDRPTFSNGAVYADLDNDGDLDIVVSNIADAALVYENKANTNGAGFSDITLLGPAANPRAAGARAILFCGDEIITAEKQPVRGFQSSMELPLHLGWGRLTIDSAWLVWPDNSYERLTLDSTTRKLSAAYRTGLPQAPLYKLQQWQKPYSLPLQDVSAESGIRFVHQENAFNEFNREPLIPRMMSTEGPPLAVADINGDGLDDFFAGNARNSMGAVYLQQADSRFVPMAQPALDADSACEDVAACWADVNGDHHPDLIVASGGNEFYGTDEVRLPRLYLNDGTGKLARNRDAFPPLYLTASAMAAADINGDGHTDLFIGARCVPFAYGQIPASYLLLGDGKGQFADATARLAPQLATAGFVTSAQWTDLDGDKATDLLLTTEWGTVDLYRNNDGKFEKTVLHPTTGWWNFALPVDYDMDGDTDLVVGNLGLNSRLKASNKNPLGLFVYDFDGNGRTEQILTHYLAGREIPFANKDELQKQLPQLKKDFLYAEDFAKASLSDLFTSEKLQKSRKFEANCLYNAVLMNQGNLKFDLQPLPWQAQLTTYRCALVADANGDKLPDILLGGNFSENNIQAGSYDAEAATWLINRGKGQYTPEPANAPLKGLEIRSLKLLLSRNRNSILAGLNNEKLRFFQVGPY